MKIKNKKQAEEFLASARKDISEVENWLKNHESSNKEEEMEKLFLELTNNLRIKINNDLNENRYFNSKNKWIIVQDKKNKIIRFSYNKFWLIFYEKFSLNYDEIKSFTQVMMEKHFGLKEYTTTNGMPYYRGWDGESF